MKEKKKVDKSGCCCGGCCGVGGCCDARFGFLFRVVVTLQKVKGQKSGMGGDEWEKMEWCVTGPVARQFSLFSLDLDNQERFRIKMIISVVESAVKRLIHSSIKHPVSG